MLLPVEFWQMIRHLSLSGETFAPSPIHTSSRQTPKCRAELMRPEPRREHVIQTCAWFLSFYQHAEGNLYWLNNTNTRELSTSVSQTRQGTATVCDGIMWKRAPL